MNLSWGSKIVNYSFKSNCNDERLPCGDGIIGVPGPGGPLDTGGPYKDFIQYLDDMGWAYNKECF